MAAVVLVLNNQKGGVGKTATSFNITKYCAEMFNVRTCLVDLDAQKNSTNSLVSEVPRNAFLASMLFAETMPTGLTPIKVQKNLDLIAGDKGLKKIDSLVDSDDRAARRKLYHTFRANLRSLAGDYDLIIIDTPTTAEHRYIAALVAADFCLSPTTLDAYGMDGIADTKETLREVQSFFGNPTLKNLGLMPNKVNRQSRLHADNMSQIVAAKIKVFPVTVYLRADVENKLNLGKRSPVMMPVVKQLMKEMKL
jgi:chromosome partitioning protein